MSGFDCEFVDPPPEVLQSCCPVCLLILREPFQVTCCGKSFCRLCILRIQTTRNVSCPTCNETGFQSFRNKGLQLPLYGFKVFCSNNVKGCDWQGEMGKLDQHLNLNPDPDKLSEGCEHAEVECLYCREVHPRHHQKSDCPERPHLCSLCKEYMSTYGDVITNHSPVCKCRPVECPNLCGADNLQLQHFEKHVSTHCPLSYVECEFRDVGCDARLYRKDLPTHMKDNMVTHMSLLVRENRKLRVQLKEQCEENTMLNLQLKEQSSDLKFVLSKLSPDEIRQMLEIFDITALAQQLREELKNQEEWKKNLCKFRVFMRHPTTNDMVERKIEVHKHKTLREATEEAYKILGLSKLVPLERCRLVKFDKYAETLDQSFDASLQDESFGFHVGGARTYYSFELFMEICPEGEEFKVYNKGGLNLKVLVIALPEETVCDPVQFRAEQGWTVMELKEALAERFSLNAGTMTLALETYQNEGKPLTDPTLTLKSEGFYRKHTVFVCCDAEDAEKEFNDSAMNRVIDRYTNSINLFITVPPPPRATQHTDLARGEIPRGTGKRPSQKTVTIQIDRRRTLGDLKKQLEAIVQVPATDFKMYRVYSNNQEYEVFRLQDTLQSVPNETKMIVRLGRALLPGEFRIKLSLLRINEVEYFKPVMDSIVSKGMTVRELKERLVTEAYEQGIEFPLQVDRMRLRKKTWQSPSTVYLDNQVFEKDIHVFANYEMFIEPLEDMEPMRFPTQMQVYVRHWHPSTYTVDKTQEVILEENTPDHLKRKLSQLSGVPPSRIQFAKAFGSFPCELSVLDLEGDLDWNPDVTTISSSALGIYDDGAILYFKDAGEAPAELSPEWKAKLQKQENARLSKYNSYGQKRHRK